MKVVYAKVVADLFHYGHVSFLKAARGLGDSLVVHVVDDQRVKAMKRQPVMSQWERMEVVAACRYVDKVVAEGPKVITREFMDSHGYDLYAFAYVDECELSVKRGDCPDLPERMLGILRYTDGISTTIVVQRILDRAREEAITPLRA